MQPEIEPPAFQLIVDPLYLLSYSHQVGLCSDFMVSYSVYCAGLRFSVKTQKLTAQFGQHAFRFEVLSKQISSRSNLPLQTL